MAKEPIYGLSKRDRDLIQQVIREVRRAPQQVIVPQRGNQKVRSTTDRFYFRNDSGETIPPGAIMRKTGTELHADGYLVQVMNKAVTAYGTPHDWYVNLGVEVEDDAYGWCARFTSEIGQAYHLSGTPSDGEWWGPKPGQWNLEQYHPGFLIHGNHADGLVYVQQCEQPVLRGVLDGTLAQGSSATVSVYCHNGSTWIDTGFNLTAHDDLLPSAGEVASAGVVWVRYYSGRWWVFEARCP